MAARKPRIPTIMLTARGEKADRIDPARPEDILTVYGIGYKMRKPM